MPSVAGIRIQWLELEVRRRSCFIKSMSTSSSAKGPRCSSKNRHQTLLRLAGNRLFSSRSASLFPLFGPGGERVCRLQPCDSQRLVHYDDDLYITGNTQVKAGLSWSTAVWAFTNYYEANWHPLTCMLQRLSTAIFSALTPWGRTSRMFCCTQRTPSCSFVATERHGFPLAQSDGRGSVCASPDER